MIYMYNRGDARTGDTWWPWQWLHLIHFNESTCQTTSFVVIAPRELLQQGIVG